MRKPTRNDVLGELQKQLSEPFTDLSPNIYEPISLDLNYNGTRFKLIIKRFDPESRNSYDKNMNALRAKFRKSHQKEWNKYYKELKITYSTSSAFTRADTLLRKAHKEEWKQLLKGLSTSRPTVRTYRVAAIEELIRTYRDEFDALYGANKLLHPQLPARKNYNLAKQALIDKYREELQGIVNRLKEKLDS